MATRVSDQPGFGGKVITAKRSGDVKRRTWITVFAASALFWAVVVLSVWCIWG
ncbi:YmiA family putative membrane protein [Erwinia piriflorinigrans]|uniref:YmiA family putative membrane protein n=1 Tax=Erwinia piriflorinigrans TaxID=665097 RepID=UPI000908287A|nr:YmiA family putative membrane protein [Erwinia piriflorinigrans]